MIKFLEQNGNQDIQTEMSEDNNFAKILATVEEDEKMLDEELLKLRKRENMIGQLKSNVSKESYRKCEKQAFQLKGSGMNDLNTFAYNKAKSIKTRIQMYKSYKNLENGKIRLIRGSTVTDSSPKSNRSHSKKLSEGTLSHHDTNRSFSNRKKRKSNAKNKEKLRDSKSKGLLTDNENSDYESEFERSARSTREVISL